MNNIGNHKFRLVSAVFSCTLMLTAGEFHLKSSLAPGVISWNSAATYVEDTVPSGTSDVVVVPSGFTAELKSDDVGSWNVVTSLASVMVSSGAVFKVTVSTDSVLDCAVRLCGDGNDSGKLLKAGSGRLTLTAADDTAASDAGYYDDYNLNIEVSAGSLSLPSGVSGSQQFRYRTLTTAEGTWLTLPSPNAVTVTAGISGTGTLTNITASSQTLTVSCLGHYVYSGRIGGTIRLDVKGGRLDLTATDNTFTGALVVYGNTTVGFTYIGGDGVPSSTGKGNPNTAETGVRLLYLGTEGTSISKPIWGGGANEQIIDAGAYGGLIFPSSALIGTSDLKLTRLVFDGSNTTESVFAGWIFRSNSVDVWPRIVKRGTGTWRFVEHASRSNTGVVAVENGMLRFDSIAEAGTNCSFGLSNELYEDYVGVKDPTRLTPYALVLGGGTDASPTEGMLEYSGNGSAFCTTRMLGVKTVGGFKSGSFPLRFKGVAASNLGDKTFVLDGVSTEENVIHTVTDGDGTLSVRKKGTGTWYLDGELSFSGTLSVDEGTLVIRSPAEKYSYYRFTIKEIGYTCSRYEEITTPSSMSDFERRSVSLSEFVLYDSEGIQQNVMSVSNHVWTQIAPGGFGFAKDSYSNALVKASSSNPLGAMFDHAVSSAYMQFPASPRLDDPSTWVPIVIRLDDGANEIERFDMYFAYTIGSAPYCGRNPTAISVEGSTDGFVWDMLYDNDTVETPAASGASLWLSKNWGGNPTAAARKDQGIPISGRRSGMPVYDVLDNVSAVYVATGATLRAENGSPVISKLRVGAYGAGTIEGFSFAANGELEIDDLASGEKGLSVSWGDCTNLNNVAGWNVVSGGKRYMRRIIVTQNGLRVLPKGISITLQ